MKKLLFLSIVLTILSCSTSDSSSNGNGNGNGGGVIGGNDDDGTVGGSAWSIPVDEVRDGGPGKDGIPSIENPMFDIASSITNLADDELIVGIKRGDDIKAYPHYILDWHEIVNDVVGNTNTTLSYCPLTGTAFAWESIVNNSFSTFGVSGLLYNANLILYDRETDSNWSQILQECVNGERIGETPRKMSVIETNWGTWKTAFPNSLVLNTNTGFDKPYGSYPYGPYKTDHNYFIFVPSPLNDALPNKERVFSIISANNNAKVYRFSDFAGGNTVRDTYFNRDYIIVGNENLIVAFELNASTTDLNFVYDYQDSETLFSDDEGNKWNMFGEAIEGPRTGQQLIPSHSVTSMWFAIAAFFPNPVIYQQ